jgi:hypothetical protein
MWTRLVGMLVTAAGAAMAFGCSHPRLEVPAAVVKDQVSTATPAAGPPTAGFVTGEVADIKVTEPIEKDGSVVSPAKPTGELKLRNSSTDQPVRFFEGKIQFIDTQGKPIRSDEKQIKPTNKLQTSAAI